MLDVNVARTPSRLKCFNRRTIAQCISGAAVRLAYFYGIVMPVKGDRSELNILFRYYNDASERMSEIL